MLDRAGTINCDLCVIGAGSGGLSVAAGAAQMGAKVVLIERGAMGGDCLNTGCVPSKSLIAAAKIANAARSGSSMGVHFSRAEIDSAGVHNHIHGVIEAIAPHDSVARFESLGVHVIKAEARFIGPGELTAGDHRIKARRFVIATGSRAALPPVKGLTEAKPLTNETIFDLTERPEHLVIVGGGPIGLEMAQAFRRLGSMVTVIERIAILPRDEPEAADLARETLVGDGVVLHENAEVAEARREAAKITVDFTVDGRRETVSGSHLLVAAGRTPNTEGLGLEQAEVKFGPKGIEVDARLRSTNHRIYAIGDVAGGPQFTHIAAYHAGIVIRNALFGLPAKVDYKALPWVTYLDPEIAHVGLTEKEAAKTLGNVKTLQWSLAENDRAQTERHTEGFVKLVLDRRGKVVGATIAGLHAGELIGLWCLVIGKGLSLSAVAGAMLPYPTLSEASKAVAGSYYTPRLFSGKVRWLVGMIQKWLP